MEFVKRNKHLVFISAAAFLLFIVGGIVLIAIVRSSRSKGRSRTPGSQGTSPIPLKPISGLTPEEHTRVDQLLKSDIKEPLPEEELKLLSKVSGLADAAETGQAAKQLLDINVKTTYENKLQEMEKNPTVSNVEAVKTAVSNVISYASDPVKSEVVPPTAPKDPETFVKTKAEEIVQQAVESKDKKNVERSLTLLRRVDSNHTWLTNTADQLISTPPASLTRTLSTSSTSRPHENRPGIEPPTTPTPPTTSTPPSTSPSPDSIPPKDSTTNLSTVPPITPPTQTDGPKDSTSVIPPDRPTTPAPFDRSTPDRPAGPAPPLPVISNPEHENLLALLKDKSKKQTDIKSAWDIAKATFDKNPTKYKSLEYFYKHASVAEFYRNYRIDDVYRQSTNVFSKIPFESLTELEAALKRLYDEKFITFHHPLWSQSAKVISQRTATNLIKECYNSIINLLKSHRPGENDSKISNDLKVLWERGNALYNYEGFKIKPAIKEAEKFMYPSWNDYLKRFHGRIFEKSLLDQVDVEGTRKLVGNYLYLLQAIEEPDNIYRGKTIEQVITDVVPKLKHSCLQKFKNLMTAEEEMLKTDKVITAPELLSYFKDTPEFKDGITENHCLTYSFKLGTSPDKTLESLKSYLGDKLEAEFNRTLTSLVQSEPPLSKADLELKITNLIKWKNDTIPPLKHKYLNEFLEKVIDVESAQAFCGWDQTEASENTFFKTQSIREIITESNNFLYEKSEANKLTSLKTARKIQLAFGNIVTLRVDAISNAANPPCLGGGGIDRAIHDTFGSDQFKSLILHQIEPDGDIIWHGNKEALRCPWGTAKAVILKDNLNKSTKANQWAKDYIKVCLQAVGPRYDEKGPIQETAELLSSAYRDGLENAHKLNLKSVAFPSISTKIFKYPLEEATTIAMRTAKMWLEDNPETSIQFVFFVIFGKTNRPAFKDCYKKVVLASTK